MTFLYKENQYPAGGDCITSPYGREPHQQALRRAQAEGALSATQMSCFATNRAPIELFAVSETGVDFTNLAQDPAFAAVREEMARQLKNWRDATGDFDFVAADAEAEPGIRKQPARP